MCKHFLFKISPTTSSLELLGQVTGGHYTSPSGKMVQLGSNFITVTQLLHHVHFLGVKF
jgi:hypothetical protein